MLGERIRLSLHTRNAEDAVKREDLLLALWLPSKCTDTRYFLAVLEAVTQGRVAVRTLSHGILRDTQREVFFLIRPQPCRIRTPLRDLI